MSEPTIKFYYGFTVLHPTMQCTIVQPPLTWREYISWLASEVWFYFSQSLLLAGSITAFRYAFGGL